TRGNRAQGGVVGGEGEVREGRRRRLAREVGVDPSCAIRLSWERLQPRASLLAPPPAKAGGGWEAGCHGSSRPQRHPYRPVRPSSTLDGVPQAASQWLASGLPHPCLRGEGARARG